MQTAVNASFSVLVGSGLWVIGIPNPALWGILGMLLRFVPYIGPVIAAALPMIVALAVDSGWSMLVWTTGLFLVVELTRGHSVGCYLNNAAFINQRQ
jgi:predicted PurR-regulated permease PerM